MPIDDHDVIEFHSEDMEAAAEHLAVRAKALGSAMDNLTQSLNPMRQTWVASPSRAGEAAGRAEERLGTAVDNIIDLITEFAGEIRSSRTEQMKADDKFAELFTNGNFTQH